MLELDFVTDMVEEQLVKGNLRWLANFSEIRRDYRISNTVFPIYAIGGLQERGFFLSRIYSALVTPKYKIHFLLFTGQTIDTKQLRRIILDLKERFGEDDWVFLGLVQSEPFGKDFKNMILEVTDKNVGIAAFSLASKETLPSNNVLGKGLTKQLKLTEAKFEAFDLPNFLKSFTIVLFFGMLALVTLAFSGFLLAIQPLSLLLLTGFSIIAGYRIYKSRYHTVLKLSASGFQLREGNKVKEAKWSDYTDVSICITPGHETCLRLQSKKETFDLPLARTGLSRKDAYNSIRFLVKKS